MTGEQEQLDRWYAHLKDRGIEALAGGKAFRCLECGAHWRPGRQAAKPQYRAAPDGRWPENWWHCPNGCNVGAE